jgi:hypothetical protein
MTVQRFRLIALALLVVALILTIIAAATNGWFVVKKGGVTLNIGLFKVCGDSGSFTVCTSTLDVGWSKDCKSRDQAAQAFIILAILALAPVIFLVIVRSFLPDRIPAVSRIPWLVDVAIACVVVVCLSITWIVAASMTDECICNSSGGASCGLNFSFGLAIVAWVFTIVGTVMICFAKDSSNDTVHVAPTAVGK